MSRRPILLAAAVLLAAGCGGSDDDDGGDRTGARAQPRPAADAKAPIRQWERAVAQQSCRLYAPTALTATRHPRARPGGPPVGDECQAYARQLPSWRGIRITGTQTLGTVVVTQGPGPRRGSYDNHTALFILDWDGRFRFYGANASDPQLRTSAKPGVDFQATADGFVKAVREKDCRAFLRYAMPRGSFFRDTRRPQDACRNVFRGRNLAPQLAADPDARPEKLGETLDLGVFGIATKGNYYTLLVGTQPTDAPGAEFRGKPDALVLDYFPNYRPAS